jgi:hypothetical protein
MTASVSSRLANRMIRGCAPVNMSMGFSFAFLAPVGGAQSREQGAGGRG